MTSALSDAAEPHPGNRYADLPAAIREVAEAAEALLAAVGLCDRHPGVAIDVADVGRITLVERTRLIEALAALVGGGMPPPSEQTIVDEASAMTAEALRVRAVLQSRLSASRNPSASASTSASSPSFVGSIALIVKRMSSMICGWVWARVPSRWVSKVSDRFGADAAIFIPLRASLDNCTVAGRGRAASPAPEGRQS